MQGSNHPASPVSFLIAIVAQVSCTLFSRNTVPAWCLVARSLPRFSTTGWPTGHVQGNRRDTSAASLSAYRMKQQEGQEESDQQENGDEWRGVGSSSSRVPDPFRRQMADQLWSVHWVTVSHRGSLTFTSVPREVIRTLYAPGRGIAATLSWVYR